ncbi:leucine-rich repeat domain-containing protein [Cytobacillus kochii]|uniref:leucine-rich repeat domain-containing protein n=1 Tax=Cytobacillus kochii TaxID=859143 RepID=UPI002041C02F|nr:leucine-rich repeat domain-containing protein [Cytobacillus kochii]MCM3324786.1 leucine-rich repeat domain-containing protein [Cytobacillus kochii]MCM3347179.1 leucine-rich repeat domain-containing protein [Cytobacillus kochii]
MKVTFLTTAEKYFRFDEFRREIIDFDGEVKNVVIPAYINGIVVTSIGPEAFWNKGLEMVVLPPTLLVIGFYAFAFNQIKEVYIPENVALIEEGAFAFNRLEKVRFGENLFSIPHAAFHHNNLSEVTFIHRYAFRLGTEKMANLNVTGMEAKNLRALLVHHAKSVDDYKKLSALYRSE